MSVCVCVCVCVYAVLPVTSTRVSRCTRSPVSRCRAEHWYMPECAIVRLLSNRFSIRENSPHFSSPPRAGPVGWGVAWDLSVTLCHDNAEYRCLLTEQDRLRSPPSVDSSPTCTTKPSGTSVIGRHRVLNNVSHNIPSHSEKKRLRQEPSDQSCTFNKRLKDTLEWRPSYVFPSPLMTMLNSHCR